MRTLVPIPPVKEMLCIRALSDNSAAAEKEYNFLVLNNISLLGGIKEKYRIFSNIIRT
jgi:hypothetical protein